MDTAAGFVWTWMLGSVMMLSPGLAAVIDCTDLFAGDREERHLLLVLLFAVFVFATILAAAKLSILAP